MTARSDNINFRSDPWDSLAQLIEEIGPNKLIENREEKLKDLKQRINECRKSLSHISDENDRKQAEQALEQAVSFQKYLNENKQYLVDIDTATLPKVQIPTSSVKEKTPPKEPTSGKLSSLLEEIKPRLRTDFEERKLTEITILPHRHISPPKQERATPIEKKTAPAQISKSAAKNMKTNLKQFLKLYNNSKRDAETLNEFDESFKVCLQNAQGDKDLTILLNNMYKFIHQLHEKNIEKMLKEPKIDLLNNYLK